jgi:hypothetical protein
LLNNSGRNAYLLHIDIDIDIDIDVFTNTQEDSTHSAAPSKCIHSSTQTIHKDRTGTDKQNVTSKHHKILLHAFIGRHAQASPEAGAT